MGLEKQGGKPAGPVGRMIGRLMNAFHTALYRDYFSKMELPEGCRVLDMGCGGGKFLQYLSRRSKSYMLYGLDHSEEMVGLSRRLNREAEREGRIKLMHGTASAIALPDSSIDLVTAFETIQFWPGLDRAAGEVQRVLDDGGTFLIINRFPKAGSKWWKLAQLRSEEDYAALLQRNGFRNIDIRTEYRRGWIVVKAEKNG